MKFFNEISKKKGQNKLVTTQMKLILKENVEEEFLNYQ